MIKILNSTDNKKSNAKCLYLNSDSEKADLFEFDLNFLKFDKIDTSDIFIDPSLIKTYSGHTLKINSIKMDDK